MNKWTILGIDKTNDKELIKKAYRAKLAYVNPEDNAEGFKQLRSAYEEAMKEADTSENVETEASEYPEGSLLYEISSLYHDFNRRIKVEEWQKLFERDEFVALDQASDSLNSFLTFLMDNYFVPQSVYKLIVDTFNIKDNKAELSEIFPENFISHIINNAKYSDPINYELFGANVDRVDEFIDTYYYLNDAIVKSDIPESARLLELIENMGVYHPYVHICKLRNRVNEINKTVSTREERTEKYSAELIELQKSAKELLADYPDDINILMICGDMAYIGENYKDAEEYYQTIGELDPDNYTIKRRMGDIYIITGEFEKAKDIFMELLDLDNYDDGARWGLTRANEGLIEQYKKEIDDNTATEDTKINLVWCYYRNSMFQEAIDVLKTFQPSAKKKFEYYNLLGRNYLYVKDYENALKNLNIWVDAILAIPEDDDSEEAKKHRDRFYHAHYYIGECYIATKDYDKARKHLDIAVSHKHEFIDYSYEAMCKLEYESGNYDACIKACGNIVDSSVNYEAYMYMAKSFYQLDELGNAIDCCEYAIRINSYYYEPYVLMLEIYWECEEYEDVERVIDRFNKLGYENDKVEYFKARLLINQGENSKSNDILLKLLNKKGTDETTLEEDDFLNVYALIATNYERMNLDEDALHYLYEGLACIPNDSYFINRIGSLYHVMGDFEKECEYRDILLKVARNGDYKKRAYQGKAAALCCMKQFDEAKSVYETLEEEFGIEGYYILDHAELLVRMNKLPECAALLKRCINELEQSPFVRSCVGNLCCFYGNEGYISEAFEVFKLAIEKDTKDYHIYRSMGFVYLDHEMYDEAKEMFLRAMEIDVENKSYTAGLYLQAINKTDDVTKPEYKKYIDLALEQLKNADDVYTYVKKAEVYRGIGEYDEALKYADLAINEKRDKTSCFIYSHEGWYEKGCIYREMGDYKNAVECYEKAIEIFGHHAQYEECLEKCKEKVKNTYEKNE